MKASLTFQDIIFRLSEFWAKQGCLLSFPYDLEKGAGTSNPETFLRALGPEPFSCAYVEPCRRPKDGRYGLNPNRLQHYFQFQVLLKPSPDAIVDLYLQSLEILGLDTKAHDIRFVHDDWENPTLGASGLGWEVWIDGMEMTQFTYFQSVAGQPLSPISGEITYGIERITMCLQGVSSIFDIRWNDHLTYGDLYKLSEERWSKYNFELQDEHMWMRHFTDFTQEASRLLDLKEPIPAYDFVLKAAHAFNMLDAKGVISVSERASYMASIRELAKKIGERYVEMRHCLGFPLCKTARPIELLAPEQKPIVTEPHPKTDTACFVLEIGIEELPASFVPIGILQLEAKAKALLAKEKLTSSSVQVFGTPRRLALKICNLQTNTPEVSEEKKGPSIDKIWNADGSLTPLGTGFFTSQGHSIPPSLESIRKKQCSGIDIRFIKDSEYLFVTVKNSAKDTGSILKKALPSIITSLEFPKSMRWGTHDLSFARPIRWITALLDTQPLTFSVGPITSGTTSFGHRLLAKKAFTLTDAKVYEQELEKRHVLVDQARRKVLIEQELRSIEKELSCTCLHFNKVLSEILYLVEYPHVQAVSFDPTLLDAPKEVIVSEMVEHQKYFPLQSKDTGKLLPFFVVTANIPHNDNVKNGNQKVLSARLNDGRFLWQEDCKIGLHALSEKLSTITYQKSLGTVEQKSSRINTLATKIGTLLGADQKSVDIASHLCKADLASHVVGEFPELQGIVGGLLAENDNLGNTIACAIKDHWLPIQEGGPLPSTLEALSISLADKIDTLIAFFSIGLTPSSSHDPYALRRQALGIVRMLIEKKLSIDLPSILLIAEKSLSLALGTPMVPSAQDVLHFINQRAKVYCTERYPKELVEAVFAHTVNNIYEAEVKLAALVALHSTFEGSEFVEVLKRTLGQTQGHAQTPPNQTLCVDPSERTLYAAIQKAQATAELACKNLAWAAFIEQLIALKTPLNDFFNKVHVLDENREVRANRIGLLWSIVDLVSLIASPKMLICMKR